MRKVVIIGGICLLCLIPILVCGQISLGTIDLGPFQIEPSASIGYKRIGYNFNLDIPLNDILDPLNIAIFFPAYRTLLDNYPLECRLDDAHLLVGGLGLDAQITSVVSLFAHLSACFPRRVYLEAPHGPAIGVSGVTMPWTWKGTRMQWWNFDVGGACVFHPGASFIAGLKLDKTSVRFSDPSPVPSYTQLAAFIPFPTFTFPDYTGDFSVYLTVPYLGFRVFSQHSKCSFIVGLAGTSLKLPLRLNHAGPYAGIFLAPGLPIIGRANLNEEALYKFSNSGLYLAANFETDVNLTESLKLTCWGDASWMRVRGTGSVSLGGASSWDVLGFLLPPTFFAATTQGPSTLNQYTYAVGFLLSATY